MILGLAGGHARLDPADHAHGQQDQAHRRQAHEHPVQGVQHPLHAAHVGGQTIGGGHILIHGHGRGDDGGLGGLGGGLGVADLNDVALEGFRLGQLVLHRRVEAVLARHGYAHVPGEVTGFPRQDGGEGIQLHPGGGHGHVLDLHGAVVGDLHHKLHRAGQGIHRGAVGLGLHGEGDLLGGIQGLDGQAVRGGFHGGAGGVRAGDGELVVRRLVNDDFLLLGHGLSGRDGQAGEHLAQHRVGDGDVRVIHIAGVLQRQRQLDGLAGGAALLVRGQGGGELHLAVLDGGLFLLLGEGLAPRLVGDGGGAGEVLLLHGGGEGIAGLLARGDGGDGTLGGGDAAVLLDGHVGHVHVAGVHHVIGNGNLLTLPGGGGSDDAVDLHRGHRAGVVQLPVEVDGLVDHLARVVDQGVLQLEGQLPGLQLALGDLPGAAPGLRGAHGQGGGAELLHLLAVGVIQRHRTGHIRFTAVGHLNGDGDLLGLGKGGLAQLHGDLQVILRSPGGHKQAQGQRQHHRQAKDQPFFHHDRVQAAKTPPILLPRLHRHGIG